MERLKDNILGIYCGTDCFRVAVILPHAKQEVVVSGKTSDLLTLSAMELLQKCNILPKEITKIVVCVGPGSFTSSRVAVSFVKGLCCGLPKVKIVPFTTFDFLAFEKDFNAVLVPAFSDYVFVRNGTDYCAKYADSFDGKIVADAATFERWGKGTRVEPNSNFLVFVEHMSKQKSVKISDLAPVYLRASQAEIEREKRNGNNA